MLNTIWRDYSVRKTISIDLAMKLRQILLSMIDVKVLIEPENKYVLKGFEITLKTDVTIYDTLYIALAAEKNLPLVTLDEKQARAAEKLG